MEKKIKKRILWISAAVLTFILLLIIGTISFINRLLPVAKTIGIPQKDEIESIYLGLSTHSMSIPLSEAQYDDLQSYLHQAEPTRIQALNDTPAIHPFYGISVKANLRSFIYYVYEDDGQVYIEMPYEGIYMANHALLTLVRQYFQED